MNELPSQIFSIPHLVESHAGWRGARTAVVANGRATTYAELDRRVNQVSNGLLSLGLKPGDAVGLAARNRLEYLEFALGALKAGGVIAPLSLLLKEETSLRLLQDADVRAVLVEHDSPLFDRVVRERLKGVLPGGWVVLGEPTDPTASRYEDWLSGSCAEAPPVNVAPEDRCTIIYSSGTTGVPKGILHSHMGRFCYGVGFAAEFAMSADSVSLLTTPMCSNASWMLILPTLYAGGSVVVMERFEPDRFLALVEHQRATHTFLVPTQIRAVLDHPELAAYDTRSLSAVISAGSRLEGDLKRRLSTLTGCGFFEIYGNTEGVGTLLKPEHLPEKIDSVGPPAGGGEIRVISDAGHELPPGQRGEVVGRNQFMSRGYFKRPDLTEELIWQDRQGRLFVRSGDLGYLDTDGFLHLVGRKKDVILSGGLNVYAADIEAVLVQFPGVIDAAVVPAPDEKWGETPFAFLEVADPQSGDAESIRTWANERLDKHQRLAGVALRSRLPRNALEKVVKAELRAELSPSRKGD